MVAKNITPDQIATTPLSAAYRLDLHGELFDFLSAYKSYSIGYLGNDTLRFELRDADQYTWDQRSGASSERTQIASKTLFANKQPTEISFGLKIDPGAANTASWLVLGQVHLAQWTGDLTGKSPPIEIGMIGERMVVKVRYSDANGKTVEKAVYTDLKDIERGHQYQFDIKTVLDPDGNGRLVVTRDGVMIADYSGSIGYPGQQKLLWGEGIYRDGAAKETMVAEFSKLAFQTDAAVKMPAADAFIAAPTLAVDKVGSALADGSRVVTVSGTAKANTSVTVYNGDTKIGVASADANGHYSLNVKIPKGAETLLNGIATDATGRSGIESKAVAVEVGTGAEIGAKLQALVAQGNVAKIVITDGTVISSSSGFNFTYLFKYGQDTLSKIQGEFSFYQTSKASGSYYDRLDQYFDSKGTLTKYVRYSNGVEKYSASTDANGTKHIVDKATPGVTSILDIDKNGVTIRSEQYNSANILIVRNLKNADGSSEQHLYSGTTGLEYKYVIKVGDGSQIVGNLNLPNRPFTTEIQNYNTAGKLVLQQRWEADGTLVQKQVWNADGTTVAHFYDGVTGVEKNFTTVAVDGSRVETTLVAGHPDQILKTISYNAAGKVIGQTTGGTVPATGGSAPVQAPAPVVTAPVVTAPVVTAPVVTAPVTQTPAAGITYTVDKNKLKTGYTQVEADGTKTVVKFKAGLEDKLLTKNVFFANGEPKLSETYDGAGNKTWSAVYAADGSHVNTQFNVKSAAYDTAQTVYDSSDRAVSATKLKAGKVVSESTLDADGTRLDKTYAADGSYTAVDKSASGKTLFTEGYNAAGQKVLSVVYAADGSRVTTKYGLTDPAFDKQAQSFDAAGKVVSTTTWKAGNVVTETKVATDGSSVSHTYDTAHREVSSTLIAADKTKDVFTFSYAGQSTTASTTQQDHYTGTKKVWTDLADASGTHYQTTYATGVKIASHEGAADVFVSGGKDTFVFGSGSGKDVIKNFTLSSSSHDTIQFDHAGVHGMSDLTITASGHDTVISFGAHDTITLQNVAPTQVKPDFFLFT